jgi:hypothetical protein
MINENELERKLLEIVKEKLVGNNEFQLNQMHFNYLSTKTGIGTRKLKELYGINKKRSKSSYNYILDKLSEFVGFSDWNSFVRNELIKYYYNNSQDLNQSNSLTIKRSVDVDRNKENKIIISLYVKGK